MLFLTRVHNTRIAGMYMYFFVRVLAGSGRRFADAVSRSKSAVCISRNDETEEPIQDLMSRVFTFTRDIVLNH